MGAENAEQVKPDARKAKLDAKGRPIAEKPEPEDKREDSKGARRSLVRMGVFLLFAATQSGCAGAQVPDVTEECAR